MYDAAGFQVITAAGDTTDVVASGAAVELYGFNVQSSGDAAVSFYDGAPTGTPVINHIVGDLPNRGRFFEPAIAFKNGCYLSVTAGKVVTVFYKKI